MLASLSREFLLPGRLYSLRRVHVLLYRRKSRVQKSDERERERKSNRYIVSKTSEGSSRDNDTFRR